MLFQTVLRSSIVFQRDNWRVIGESLFNVFIRSAERKAPITKACATEAITTLRMYIECCENTDETIFKSLTTVEIAVSTPKQTQTSILDFFKPTQPHSCEIIVDVTVALYSCQCLVKNILSC